MKRVYCSASSHVEFEDKGPFDAPDGLPVRLVERAANEHVLGGGAVVRKHDLRSLPRDHDRGAVADDLGVPVTEKWPNGQKKATK